MAIAAAAAAARTQLPEVRMAYLLMAESWSDLAKAEEEQALTPAGDGSAMPTDDHQSSPLHR
jgi:hypothetical protein